MSYEDELRGALATFVVEARELLQEMEDGLLGLEQGGDPTESVAAIFRAAHTIKGSSGLFGLDHIVRFTHAVESLLDRLRYGEVDVTAEVVDVLLPCRDHMAGLVEAVAAGHLDETPEQAGRSADLLGRLQPLLAGSAAPGEAGAGAAAAADPVEAEVTTGAPPPGEDEAGARLVHLSLRFGPDSLRNGMDPLSFVRYLSTIGDVVATVVLPQLLPDAQAMDPETCYVGFEVTLRSQAPVAEIEGVFDFVRDDGQIIVVPAEAAPAAFVDLVASHGELGEEVAAILVASGIVAPHVLGGGEVLLVEREGGDAGPAEAAEQVTPTQPAALPQQQARTSEARSIRVDAPRLDRLIDAVGELVIAGASAQLTASAVGNAELVASIGEIMRLVEEVRDSALTLRMVPIGTTFGRFQRVVRDVSAELGKDISLVVTGGDTEVDKALVERVGDPLMHLVRNAVDHGIETPQVRSAAGKPARGTLRLNAFHDSGSIVIEVADDGGGIDPERVLARAVQRGLVEPGAPMTDKDVHQLLFEPGFSTKDVVSDLSGRGVGMDVVKRNVTALRGTIDVESTLGAGTTWRIRLPLTLAIIDGFLVGVGSKSYVIPLDRVVECVELPAGSHRRGVMDLRGEVLPFIRLRELFGIDEEPARRQNVVVVEYAGLKTGLVVDALMGEFQTVIKPLGRLFAHVRGVGGSTILGTGEVALIIDVPTLVTHYGERAAALFATAGRS